MPPHSFSQWFSTFNTEDIEIGSNIQPSQIQAPWWLENAHWSLEFSMFLCLSTVFPDILGVSHHALISFYSAPWRKQWTRSVFRLFRSLTELHSFEVKKQQKICGLLGEAGTFGGMRWVGQDGRFMWCSFNSACVLLRSLKTFVRRFVETGICLLFQTSSKQLSSGNRCT